MTAHTAVRPRIAVGDAGAGDSYDDDVTLERSLVL